MFDLPPPTPTLQIELASTGISKGLAQTRGPQLVVRPGLAFGKFSVEGLAKNIENNDDHGVESQFFAVYATKAAGFELSRRGGLKSIHGLPARPIGARSRCGSTRGARSEPCAPPSR